MERRSILIQLDADLQPSVFDRVVAVDAGADEIFSYGGITPEHVRGLVHGAIFTRGAKHLKRTAIFIGGSDVAAGERLMDEVRKHMMPQYGLQVSVLLDANGCNTTAAAAVHACVLHHDPKGTKVLVLGGTGPVGQRVARLLARAGAQVRVGSRQKDRAEKVCSAIRAKFANAEIEPWCIQSGADTHQAMSGCGIVFAAGAAGVQLLSQSVRIASATLRVAIDLNAVPPVGIEGVEITDKATMRNGVCCYGAIGVGDLKMKIHKAAIARLFESNQHSMDAEEVYSLATTIPH